jgi:hypothetical protein
MAETSKPDLEQGMPPFRYNQRPRDSSTASAAHAASADLDQIPA